MRVLILLFLVITTMTACKNDAKTTAEITKLEDEVLALHDAVMARDAEANRLGRSLKAYKDTLSVKEEDALLPQVIESIIRLREAQDTMRSWMDNFKKPEGVSADSMKSFYANQKSIMAGIGDMYLKSMAEAEAILPKKGN